MECWIRSFVVRYGLRVAGYARQSLVCNILTRNAKLETLQFRYPDTPSLQYSKTERPY